MEAVKQALKQTSLPLYLTAFVGRKQEQESLTSILLDKPLLTLVGSGGLGKTRLALHIASEMMASFTDGVFLIELASLTQPTMLLQTVTSALISSALNIQTDQDSSLLPLIASALQERHCLLVFDNCEHVVEACASLIEVLLHACPRLHILATSREPLHIAEETIWRVAALSSPQPEQIPPLEQLAHYEAIQLFCQRAVELDPRFHLTAQNAPAIVRICHQLDGIPLALELATACLSVLSVDQLATRLNASFSLLTYGERTAISHQQTLQATFDWSYALLTTVEQALFQRLAVFAGSWNREALEHIMGPEITKPYDPSDVLNYLVNKSLVIAEEQEGQEEGAEEVRYHLLKTVQQYALEKGQQADDWLQVCERRDAWYLYLAEEASIQLRGAEQLMWLQYLDADMPNIRAALTRSLTLGRVETVVRIAEAVSRFWIIRNQFSEGRYWFDTLLTMVDDNNPPSLRARVLFGAAEFARYQGAHERTCTLLEEEVALLQTLDEPARLAEAQVYLGTALGMKGEHERAHQLCQIGLNFYRVNNQIGGITRTLIALSLNALSQGKYLHAITLSEECCSLLRDAGDYSYLLYALFTLAHATILQGNVEQARHVCQEALHLSQQLKQTFGLAACLGLIASVARLQGQFAQAARLFGAAQALQKRVQAPLPPSGQAMQERMVFLVRDALGAEQFNFHYSDGQKSPLEQILAEAEAVLQTTSTLPVADTSALPSALSAASPLAILSQREREILALVASGLGDAQVAKRLLISRYTVSSHLQSIYTKLHINSRGAATRLALENGLI